MIIPKFKRFGIMYADDPILYIATISNYSNIHDVLVKFYKLRSANLIIDLQDYRYIKNRWEETMNTEVPATIVAMFNVYGVEVPINNS